MDKKLETQKLDEGKLRKSQELTGTWVTLGDKQEWCIRPMTLGKGLEESLRLVERFSELEEKVNGDESNIKDLTEFTRISADLCYRIISSNYPDLTREQFDEHELVDVKIRNRLTAIYFGNDFMADLIIQNEGKKDGEKKKAENLS